MSQYQHSPLSLGPDSIRLLRLLPHEDKNARIQCQLFDYSLQGPGERMHLYDALSYVWGDSKNPRSIYIGKYELPVTENLFAALLQLRNFSFERIIWVDAICINQKNVKEKEQQIQLMAKIYSQANRVLVWLGEAADNSDQALEEIRAAGGKAVHSLKTEVIQSALLALLRRKWFRRIWVLQEVAAARQVLIMCGPIEMDGYAFCLGIDSLSEFYETYIDLRSLIRSVTYLIRGAIFRPHCIISRAGGVPHVIYTLGELIDMYHSHEATLLHDKVYALLGMTGISSEDLSRANLLPNYEDKWEELLQRVAKYLLCQQISVEAWSGKEIAIIKSKGCILGRISSLQNIISLGGRQGVDIIFKNISRYPGYGTEWSAHWALQPSAKPIRKGDLICFLEGASQPTIIRSRKDHFVIIMILASPLETGQTEREYIKLPKVFARDFLLVWDWGNTLKSQDLGEYDALVRKDDWVLEYSKTKEENNLNRAARIWNVVMILDDVEEYREADERLREAIAGFEIAFETSYLYLLGDQHSRTPLSWVARNGHEAAVKLLLEHQAVADSKDIYSGRTPLSYAAENGHEPVVKLLLEYKVDINSKDEYDKTPLSWATRNGHEAVVKLLLEHQAMADTKDIYDDRTPLSYAAENGHEPIVKLLLEYKADANSKYKPHRTPLSWAVGNGHEAVVKLLLEHHAIADAKDAYYDRTPLSYAAENGYEPIVKLLLEHKVDVESKDWCGRTPLSWAAGNGHEAIVQLLLETSIIEVDSKDIDSGQTPLSYAAENGHERVVKLLLEYQADINSKDKDGRTPFSWATGNGHEDIVKLLLETSKVKVDSKDKSGRTPFSWATGNGHEAIVKLLLETSEVKVDSKDRDGWTPLCWAIANMHEAVIELLLENDEIDVDSG